MTTPPAHRGQLFPPVRCHHCNDTGWVKGQVFLPLHDALARPIGWHATLVAVDVSCSHCDKGFALWRTNNQPLRRLPSGVVG